jgi:hypothetical protein
MEYGTHRRCCVSIRRHCAFIIANAAVGKRTSRRTMGEVQQAIFEIHLEIGRGEALGQRR